VIRLLAASADDKRTSEPVLRKWARHLLRDLLQADTALKTVLKQWEQDDYDGLRRGSGNPNLRTQHRD
jgi:hypothetical protein